jgi:hypothetical protein
MYQFIMKVYVRNTPPNHHLMMMGHRQNTFFLAVPKRYLPQYSYGRVDLLPSKKNYCSCVGNPFCTLHYVSRTIIDEVIVPLSKGVVGLLAG